MSQIEHEFRILDLRWRVPAIALALAVALIALAARPAEAQDPNDPGVLEPVLSAVNNDVFRIPHTDQAEGDQLLNVVGQIEELDPRDTVSMLGYPITSQESPNDDMERRLKDLADAAKDGDGAAMAQAARDLQDILLGTTQGKIYDGFAMLNFNRGAFVADHVPGEYKMKTLRDTGLTEVGITGDPVKIWEVDVNMLYYDGQIDSDTFLLHVPETVSEFDTIRINYTIYSTEKEDFSPTVVMLDRRQPGSVQFPFKGLDQVWFPFGSGSVTHFTMAMPPNRLVRGIYTWGWRVHPPRIQFIQPVFSHVNQTTGEVDLEPAGKSWVFRNRMLSLDGIGDAAPEKKMYTVTQAVLDGASTSTIDSWLTDPDAGPRGTWDQWADLAENQRQLPPEAWDVVAQEDGLAPGEFGPYRFISAFVNNEMYGVGPEGSSIEGWQQGDRFQVKLINLDDHTHYFRNVDFGPRLHDDVRDCCSSGRHSFEIMNFKPSYGAPKVAEAQWRAGWGFRPHHDVIQQQDVFPRASDQQQLKTFFGGDGTAYEGYQYSAEARQGDFRFNPPNFIIGTTTDPSVDSQFRLKEADGTDGLLIGQHTEGYGVAQFCPDDPFPGFCQSDVSQFNPNGALNFDTDGDGQPDELRFPPFLRNPDQGASNAGDIIPPTPAWKPFLFLNPANGTIFIDPDDPSQGFWVDRTYAHGAPVFAGQSLDATVEAPRGSAQVFYQFDDLFHDNDIFSPHPTFITE